MTIDPLVLKFGGSLVEQLGAQLYPSATATVAELISNAWDADARHVWVTIPYGESWIPESEIVVVDDGHGMSREEAQHAYLVVGRKRRLEATGDRSKGGRKVHGRKGIGKLAAFGTAGILECVTRAVGTGTTSFRLDYDAIRKLHPDQDYVVEPVEQDVALADPEGNALAHGTRVRLTGLLLRRALSADQFMRSMSRRFAISQAEMAVSINGVLLNRFDMDVQFRFPRDGSPPEATIDQDGWAAETVDGKQVRWWIGFTAKPLTDDTMQGISVLARGKMAQRPFKFERAQGTEGQLGQEYLVGEVEADWLDEGFDIEDDLIQSNRDQLQLEDARLVGLMEWGRRRLAWALRERNRLRQEVNIREFEANDQVAEVLKEFTKTEKQRYFRIATIAAKWPEMEPEGVVDLIQTVVDAQSDRAVRQLMEEIEQEEEPIQERMWALVHEFGLIDARRNMSIIHARLETIEKLANAVKHGAREVPEIHSIVRADAWLLDPRWHLLDDEVDISTLGVHFDPETDEKGERLDFLFVLTPKPPAIIDEAVVVEIKRGSHASGAVRKVSVGEVDKFHNYVLAVKSHYAKSTKPPVVRGLLVAQDYTAEANLKRTSLESILDPRLEFKTWDRVIDETRRMHTGWLAVSRRRAGK